MNVNLARFARDLEFFEGREEKAYRDSRGIITIGVGRNLESVGLSTEEINHLLRNDVARVHCVARELPIWTKLDDVRARVVMDMIFNMGLNGFLRFRKMIAAIERQDWGAAADEMVDSAWYGQVGRRSRILVERMRSGRD